MFKFVWGEGIVGEKGMVAAESEDRLSLRVLVLFLFPSILLISLVSSYYLIEKSNWTQVDPTLAITMKMFYLYVPLSAVCLFAVLVWLVIDERKIGRLTRLQEEKNKGESG